MPAIITASQAGSAPPGLSAGNSLVPITNKAYDCNVRLVVKTLFVLLVMGGLTIPRTMAHLHDVDCGSQDSCPGFAEADCEAALSCQGCPPPEEIPCDHEHHDHDGPFLPHQDGNQCPSQPHQDHHHHHHHHQCVCSSANFWLITDSDPFSLHPPQRGRIPLIPESLFAPESPVYLLDRPPMA